MRNALAALIAAIVLILAPTAATADDARPTPYIVSAEGIHLPEGDKPLAAAAVAALTLIGGGALALRARCR